MRLTIKANDGEVLGTWVARTVRGFNKQQRREIDKVRLMLAREAAADTLFHARLYLVNNFGPNSQAGREAIELLGWKEYKVRGGWVAKCHCENNGDRCSFCRSLE